MNIVKLVENRKKSDSSDLSNEEQTNYYEILPLEIQEQIKNETNNIEMFIIEFFDFVKEKIENGNYSKLFWKNRKPVKEAEIQIILYNLMEAYFYKRDINISRESLVGHGRIDFTCYINKKECLLIEIKKANNTNLIAGYEEQTIQYMKSYQCQKAIYLIFCFNDKDMARASELSTHHNMYDIYHSYIRIIIIDVRDTNKAFINKGESMFSKKMSYTVDAYFKSLHNIFDINTSKMAAQFLLQVEENYNKLETDKLKKEYFTYFTDIISDTKIVKEKKMRYYDNSDFYQIYDLDDKYKIFLIKMLLNLRYDKSWITNISKLRKFYESLKETDIDINLNKKDVEKIFKTIKSKKTKVYWLLSKIRLDIFLFNEIYPKTDELTLFSQSFEDYILCCFVPADIKKYMNETNPVYSFFSQVSYSLYLYITFLNKEISKIYSVYMFHTCKDEVETQIAFISGLCSYIMHNTKYEKYDPLHIISKDNRKLMYKFYQKLFSNLGKEDL